MHIVNKGWGLRCNKPIKENKIIAYLTLAKPVECSRENLRMRNDYKLQIGDKLFLPRASETQLAGLANDGLDDQKNNSQWRIVNGRPALVASTDIEIGTNTR